MHTISTVFTHRELVKSKTLIRAIFITGFILLTALGAYVRIPVPFSPVPITLQTFFVILCGAILGKKFGAFTQASYVGLGAFGLPIFQGYAAGLTHIMGPTGGYLVGFVIAAFVVGVLTDKNKPASTSCIIFSMSIGLLAVYLSGVTWLVIGFKFTPISAISVGVIPFIPGAIAKLFLASLIYSKIQPRTDLLLK